MVLVAVDGSEERKLKNLSKNWKRKLGSTDITSCACIIMTFDPSIIMLLSAGLP